MSDEDLVSVGYYSREWLIPTAELRFVERDGKRILQQKWRAEAEEMHDGHKSTFEAWRWKDVPLDLNPERDSV